MDPRIKFMIILNRAIGCDDESATDEEQAEKILHFYPENTTVYDQLTKINMLEGLIDFTSKFSSEPISVVTMKKLTWGFLLCEPNTWIIVAVNSRGTKESALDHSLGMFSHQVNTHGLVASIHKFYSLYYSFHGSIGAVLRGNISGYRSLENRNDTTSSGETYSGLETLENVKLLRKQIRKLNRRLSQEQQDFAALLRRSCLSPSTDNDEEIEEHQSIGKVKGSHAEGESSDNGVRNEQSQLDVVEYIGVQDGQKTLEQARAEVAATTAEIEAKHAALELALIHPAYTLPAVRQCLARFARWYLSAGEMGSTNFLQAVRGIRVVGAVASTYSHSGVGVSPNAALALLSTYGAFGGWVGGGGGGNPAAAAGAMKAVNNLLLGVGGGSTGAGSGTSTTSSSNSSSISSGSSSSGSSSSGSSSGGGHGLHHSLAVQRIRRSVHAATEGLSSG